MNPDKVTYLAATDARGKQKAFGIKADDRSKHIYVIGKTGMGKSTLLENMAIQDIQNGEGFAFIDPHGSTAEKLLDYVPESRINDVIYFAPFDMEYPVAFNVMEDVGYDKRHLVVSGLMSAFKKIWVDAWSARMEYILTNVLLALLEYPDSTLLDVNKMLVDKVFRKKVVEYITDPTVKDFWVGEFANYTDRYTQDATPAIQNKVGQFTSNPLIRNIIGQPKSTFDLRKVMDTKKILIVNLSKGRMGETNAELLGSMLTTKIYLSAMSRADEPAAVLKKLPPFYFYVDEFQSVANDSFADILSEARKYKLSLTLAHQYVEQMEENVRNAVFGNVGTTIAFRVGPFDAEALETVFQPYFMAEDIVNLGRYQMYLTLMIDGVGSQPFSATGLPPIESPEVTYREEIIEFSRKTYACPRADIEEALRKRNEVDGGQKPQQEKNDKPQSKSFSGPREPRRDIRHHSNQQSEQKPTPPKHSAPPQKNNHPSPQKTLSLSQLKQRVDTKGPSAEQRESLRQALAQVMQNAPKKEEKKEEKKPEEKKTESVASPQVSSTEPNPREVPKDVLEKILQDKKEE
jgi:hypothetical protein